MEEKGKEANNKNGRIRLILEDGSSFDGFSFGKNVSVSGEVVFNTGMVGYPESLTDPSYKGQILVLTYPLIGNYGVAQKSFESDKIQVSGLIVSDYSKDYYHWSASKSLSQWLKENNVPGIYGIDTRALTKKLREKGVMLGKIVYEKDKDVEIEDPNKRNLVAEVSTKKVKIYNAKKETKILLIDCGVKNSIIRSLLKRNVSIIQIPWNYNFSNIEYDGIIISNGPGDPKMCNETIENIKKMMESEKNLNPIFGICLGNQILALASGAETYKLKYGHRSQNQPCIDIDTKRCFITSQNHGYAVDTKTLKKEWKAWFVNANDKTNEGIKHKNKPFMSVQWHPEANPGPVDTSFLFDKFIRIVKEYKNKK